MFRLHAWLLKNAPACAWGVFTDADGTTRIVLPRTYYPPPQPPLHSSDPVKSLVHRAVPFSHLNVSFTSNTLEASPYHHHHHHAATVDRRTIIAFCDVSCPGNERGAVGVFFGPQSQHNVAECLSPFDVWDTQRAHLHAVLRALQVVRAHRTDGTVVLATSSAYVVRVLTEWVFEWRQSEWLDERGRAVDNADKIAEVDRLIEGMEAEGLDVEFWQVRPEDCQDAHEMADAACIGQFPHVRVKTKWLAGR